MTLEIKKVYRWQSENEKLKNLLKFIENSKLSVISSRLILKTGINIENRYVINIGFCNNIKKGFPITDGLNLIGKIVYVSKKKSIVQLINDVNFRVPIIIGNNKAIAQGSDSKNEMKINFLDRSVQIQKGDLVLTSGEGQLVPYGLLLGQIIFKNQVPYIRINHLIEQSIVSIINSNK